MRRVRLTLGLGVTCAVLVACSSRADPPPGAEPGASPHDVASSPSPSRHSDQELVAALPQRPEQLLGLPLGDSCRTMSGPCPMSTDGGVAYVRSKDDAQVAVFVFRQLFRTAWTEHVAGCPQGRYEVPLEFTDDNGSYRPGERGTSRRTHWVVGSWTGFVCEKSLVYLWPEGKHSERTDSIYAFLNNGRHLLRVEGRTPDEARQLATDYVERLEGVPGPG